MGQGHLNQEDSKSHTTATAVGRTTLDKWSALRRQFYLTKNNNNNRQTSVSPLWGERPYFARRMGSAKCNTSARKYRMW